jgi:hypothetical protein
MRRPVAVAALAAVLLLPAVAPADMMDVIVGERDLTAHHALAQGARDMYAPLPAEEVARLPAEEKLRYVLDNIYRAKSYKRFQEGKDARQAAADGMKLLAETATKAEFVALWSMVDGKFIAALNGDGSPLRTTRKVKISEERSVTLYALSWADVAAVLTDYPAYRKQATAALLELAAAGNFGACRVFESLYPTGVGANPHAGDPNATWLDANGVGQRRGEPRGVIDDTPPPPLPEADGGGSYIPLPLPKTAAVLRTIVIPLPRAVEEGCQRIRSGGGNARYRRMVEGHFRTIAKEFAGPGTGR